MKPCKITEDKQLHTTSKELMVVAMTRRKNSDEKSGGGPCCEGLDQGITNTKGDVLEKSMENVDSNVRM